MGLKRRKPMRRRGRRGAVGFLEGLGRSQELGAAALLHNAEELERLAAAWVRLASIALDPEWSGSLDLHVVIEAGVIGAESGVRLLRDEGRSGGS